MNLKYIIPVVLLLISTDVSARSIDLNINSDALRLTYASVVSKNVVTDVGFLYIDKGNKFKDEEIAWHAGLNLVSGDVRFGARALFVTPGESEALAIGFGGQARFALANNIGLGGHFYYAPEVTSMLDAKGYHEYSIRLDFKIAPSGYIYLGYRNMKVSIGDRNNKVEIDDDVMLGFKVYF